MRTVSYQRRVALSPNRRGMPGLVEADAAAAGECQLRKNSPALFLHGAQLNFMFLQRLHSGFEVVAHEIEFVSVVFFVRMESGLGGRQREDQPSVAGVD